MLPYYKKEDTDAHIKALTSLYIYKSAEHLSSAGRKWLCKRMLISGNWFQAINLICCRAVHCMPKIPILLQAQPEVRGHTQNTGKSQCRIRSYRTSAFNNFVETRIRNAQATSEFCLCKVKRLDEFLEKHFPGMCRWTISRQPPSNISGSL